MDDWWEQVMGRYGRTCCFLGCWGVATEVHEEPPRSQGGKYGEDSYPICKPCHEKVTANPSLGKKVIEGAKEVLLFYADPA